MTATGGSRGRPWVAGVLGGVAVLAFVLAALGAWTRWTVTDTDQIVDIVDDTLQIEEVADSLAAAVVEQAVASVDVAGWVEQNVPPRLQDRTSVFLAGLRSVVEDEVSELIRADGTRQLVSGAVGAAHAALVRVVEGDGLAAGVTVDDGEVRLNVLPLVSRALARLQELGLLPGVEVPELEPGGDPAEQRAELATALDRDLPPGFGELVVYRGDRVDEATATVRAAQETLVTVDRALWVLVVLAVVATAGAVWAARRRWRALLLVTVCSAVLMIVVQLLAGMAVRRAPGLVEDPGAQRAVSDVLSQLQDSLARLVVAFTVVALAGCVAAFVVVRRDRVAEAR